MSAMTETVRETRDGETGIEVQEGGHAGTEAAPDLDPIGRMYEEAKACIAETGSWPSPVIADPCPPTKPIDAYAIRPPAASTRWGSAPDRTPPAREADAPARHPVADRLVAPLRPWRRWFSLRVGTAVVPR